MLVIYCSIGLTVFVLREPQSASLVFIDSIILRQLPGGKDIYQRGAQRLVWTVTVVTLGLVSYPGAAISHNDGQACQVLVTCVDMSLIGLG